MAEALLSGVVEGIVGTLTPSVLQEIGLWWGVKDEIELLRTTIVGFKVVLRDAEDRQARGDDEVKEWIDELKEVLYDADDLLDDFSTEVRRRQVMTGNKVAKEVRLFFSSSNQLAYGLKMGHKIKAIRERLDTVMDVGMKFNFQQRPGDTLTSVMAKKREETHSFVPEVFVGREDDKNKITQLLLSTNDGDANVSVISIVGIGGLGKTTLAKLVYNDENVKSQFDLRMWVCVSGDFDVKMILERILESVTEGKPGMCEMNALIRSLHKEIRGKRYLLVLDDVWNDDSERWYSLRDLLVSISKESRILVTTRSKKVAKITSPSQAQYELSGLSDKDSWSLFAQIAFKKSEPPAIIKTIGKKIVTKFRGVPLAIRAIGGVMCLKETIGEWESFENKELTMMDPKESGILTTLKLSYDHLPLHLKHCFAYCRLFPKDHKINVDTLVTLWMAQGYIKLSDPSQCLENIGRECFKDLLWRSFFQEEEKDELGNIISCKMHDLMHDLASSVARMESACVLTSNPRAVDEKTRHISFFFDLDAYIDNWQVPISVLEAKNLRTFLTLNPLFGVRGKIVKGQCKIIFHKLKRLRLLDLQDLDIETVPHSIGKLKHLRYLDLSDNGEIKMLPRSITRLQNLQVLKLTHCWGLTQLPMNIKKLVNLRQLDISNCVSLTHMPRGIGRLTLLEKLSRFVLPKSKNSKWKQRENQSGGLDELHDLNNLGGKLWIMNLPHHRGNEKYSHDKKKGANLREKSRLQELGLIWEELDSNDIINDNDEETSLEALQPHPNLKKLIVENYGGMKFASWLSSLTNLVRLELKDCPKCRSLPGLDQFPLLKHIKIEGLIDLEYIDVQICSNSNSSSSSNNNNSMVSSFPSLESMYLFDCPNLEGWRPSSPSSSSSSLLPQFQCLSELEIRSCPKLTSMLSSPSLKRLEIVSGSFKTLEQMLKGTISLAAAHDDAPSSSSSLPSNNNNNHLSSSLNKLWISEIEDMPEDFLPVELLQTLNSLEVLIIRKCPTLTRLPHAKMLLLTSLKSLQIISCEGLDLSNYDDDDDGSNSNSNNNNNNDAILWQGPGLRSLTNLEFSSIPKLVHLPRRLLLRSTVLKGLRIWNCPNLESLPEWMPNLTSLQYLTIDGCSLQLSERCNNNMGEDWPKIAHIPNIIVRGRWIQCNGCYNL